MKYPKRAVVVAALAMIVATVLSTPIASAATAPTLTWKVASLSPSSSISTSAIASSNSTGTKTWSVSGSCTLKSSKVTTKASGYCTVTLSVKAKGKYAAKKVSKKFTIQAAPVISPSTTAVTYATLWEKYKWTKPASSSDSITAAISNFNSYVATTRTSGTTVTVRSEEAVTSGSQPGSSTWEKVMSDAVNLGAKAFTYPALTKPFYVYLATTSAWLGSAINGDGFTDGSGIANVMSQGTPASSADGYFWASITSSRSSLSANPSGTYQTPGHEFFHSIQKWNCKCVAYPDGSVVPQWFWEGGATFVGELTANNLGTNSYASSSRVENVRSITSSAATRGSLLSEAITNTNSSSVARPYDIGSIATEFLVANIGMEKYLKIYSEKGTGKSFDSAFLTATGVSLTDFYSMFEEVRATLGIAKQ